MRESRILSRGGGLRGEAEPGEAAALWRRSGSPDGSGPSDCRSFIGVWSIHFVFRAHRSDIPGAFHPSPIGSLVLPGGGAPHGGSPLLSTQPR